MFVQASPRHREVGLQHCILTQKTNAINSVVSDWEALVECGVVLTIGMKPGFCKRVNIVLGTEIKTNVKTKQTAWD